MKVKLDPGACMPVRAHDDDAGLDIRTPVSITVGPATPVYGAGKAVVTTGVHVEIPKGYVGFIKSKSGLNVNNNITVDGVVDCGFTGSIVVKLYNHGYTEHHFDAGDKIAQLVILPILTPELEQVDELDDTERGASGFGSTGK